MKPFVKLLKDFSGGLNIKYGDEQMELNEARDLQNCDPQSKGWLDRRKGCASLTTSMNSGDLSVDNLIRFYHNATTKQLITSVNRADHQHIYEVSDSTGDVTEITSGTALTAGKRIRFATYGGYLFLTDGVAPIEYYETGTTKADIGGTPTPPVGKFITVHKRRLYVANGADLAYSGLGIYSPDPGTCDFPATNTEPIGDTTLDITGIQPQQDHIVIFKENTFHKWIGTAEYDFRVLDTNRPYGCIAPDSIAMCEGWVVFLAHDGVRAFDGGLHAVLLSDKITPIIDGSSTAKGMDVSKRQYARGTYHDGIYRLSYHGSNATHQNKEIVFNFRKWLESNGQAYAWGFNAGINIGAYCEYQRNDDNNYLMAGDSNAQFIYRLESGYSDNVSGCATGGNIIDIFWKSKRITDFEGLSPHQIKKYRKLKMATYLTDGTFEIGYDIDDARASSGTVAQVTTGIHWNENSWGLKTWSNAVTRSVGLGLSPNCVGEGISVVVREKTGKGTARVDNLEIFGKAKPYK